MSTPKALNSKQTAFNNFLKVPKKPVKISNVPRFSPFDTKQAIEAANITNEFMQISESNPNDFADKVLDSAKKHAETKDPEMVRWSLLTFIANDPTARNSNLRIPSMSKRAPNVSLPKKQAVLMAGPVVSDKPTASATTQAGGNVELLLNWFREDPNFNEHHEHWHFVYPGRGIRGVLKDRHGELFIYMHRQMLARMDFERLALGIPIIKPLDNYREVIQEGYVPDDDLVDSNDDSSFSTRPPKSRLRDLDQDFTIAKLEGYRKSVEDAIKNGKFYNGNPITPDLLGNTLESNIGTVSEERYGDLHNSGHVLISYINDDPGVMSNPRVAARDPIFWRWHRHIDDLFEKWQDTLKPNDFSDAPSVNIRNGDIILAYKEKLPIDYKRSPDEQNKTASDFGTKTFGGTNFDADVKNNQFVTHELQTKMKKRTWYWPEDSGRAEEIEYLFPREYYYFFRVENTSSSPLEATFRIFLAPEEMANSKRHWIEMDKFKQTLPPKSKTVVSRDCDLSSIVRQPPQKTVDQLDDTLDESTPNTREWVAEKFCDCGWPFHLMVPRGKKDGMKFKLLVFITDWSKDQVPSTTRCGSLSFCGAERANDKYPDRRPMGYPFDRPFKNKSYKDTFTGLRNVSIKDITIRWVDDFRDVTTA